MLNDEFILVICWKISHLYDFCRKSSFNDIMNFKRDLQVALANYARHNKYDSIQEKAIAMIGKIEKWCSMAFIEREMKQLNRIYPSWSDKRKKVHARQNWEVLNRKWSY